MESDISGSLLNKTYFSDVEGTWLTYEVRIPVKWGEEAAYDALYEVLTNAVGEHSFIMPYAQGTVSFTGRIKQIKDKPYKGCNGSTYWLADTFQFISNTPYKTPGNNVGQGVS